MATPLPAQGAPPQSQPPTANVPPPQPQFADAPPSQPSQVNAPSPNYNNNNTSYNNNTREQHQREVEEREGYEHWGYLFKPDKTGTDKLKDLLRGLKDVMNEHYEPSDNPDLTPTQLAHFYRDLHGNYDQLFLGTPSESIGFIYKSLGCLHSLQPLSQSTAFTDPTVPALKTEGWIMWQTIQLLLGPEEHSSFLIEALQRWNVKSPTTGEVFPKILPRRCFPTEPDKHMVAWYEGVSERLRKEADDEERQREIEAQQAETRRLHDKVRRDDTDDEGSVDSRGPALAYFRNPLYRHVDGRPSIVRYNSKRPPLSPRPASMMDKGKEAATSVGHVIRNIGSPHLWDGRKPSNSRSRERDRDRRRRSSHPENRYLPSGDVAIPASHTSRHSSDNRPPSSHHHRRPSLEVPGEDYDGDESAAYSPRPSPRVPRNRYDNDDASLRHSRSHEPTPSQQEYGDYFEGYDDSNRQGLQTPNASTSVGPSFAPSASPLFASHIAKQPQPTRQPLDSYRPSGVPQPGRRPQGHPPSRSPDLGYARNRDDRDPRQDDRGHHGYDSPRRSRVGSPSYGYDDSGTSSPPGSGPPGPPLGPQHHPQPGFPPMGGPITAPPGSYPPGGSRDRRSTRTSGSDVSGTEDQGRDRRSGPPKHARFAAGVDGRKYPDENPWR